jgi:hypothetical protein
MQGAEMRSVRSWTGISIWKSNYSIKILDASFSPQRPGFNPRAIHVRFVVDKLSLRKVFLQVPKFSPVSYYCTNTLFSHLLSRVSTIVSFAA